MGEIGYLLLIMAGLMLLVAIAVVVGLESALHTAEERESDRTRRLRRGRRCPNCGTWIPE